MSTTEHLDFAKIQNTLNALMTTSGTGGSQSLPANIGGTVTLSHGTGDLQGTKIIEIYNTNLSNTNTDINVTTALDKAGIAAGLTKISAYGIKYESGTAGSYLTFKQPASNGVPNIFLAAGDGMKLAVGEYDIRVFASARPVTASTADLIFNVISTVTDAYYSLVVIGS